MHVNLECSSYCFNSVIFLSEKWILRIKQEKTHGWLFAREWRWPLSFSLRICAHKSQNVNPIEVHFWETEQPSKPNNFGCHFSYCFIAIFNSSCVYVLLFVLLTNPLNLILNFLLYIHDACSYWNESRAESFLVVDSWIIFEIRLLKSNWVVLVKRFSRPHYTNV